MDRSISTITPEAEDMTADEHLRTALDWLDVSDREFAAGDELQGSEKLWGAASHAVLGLAMRRGWHSAKYSSRVAAVKRIAAEHDEPVLPVSFSVAKKFHANFYNGFMEEDDIEDDRPVVHNFVKRIVELAGPVAMIGVAG